MKNKEKPITEEKAIEFIKKQCKDKGFQDEHITKNLGYDIIIDGQKIEVKGRKKISSLDVMESQYNQAQKPEGLWIYYVYKKDGKLQIKKFRPGEVRKRLKRMKRYRYRFYPNRIKE